MDYYPQSMGPLTAPFVPYLDQLAVGQEKIVYQPHLKTILPSAGSYYTRRIPINPPTITVQCESGMFACNYHEIRKDIMVDELNELVVPPWLERNPTPHELAVEEKFRAQEEHWENKYWEGMEKKMREAAKAQERVESGGRRPATTANILKPGLSVSPSHIQKADSFRRVLKKEGSLRSGGAGSSKGLGAESNYTGSECGTARPLERRHSVASSVATKTAGGRGGAAAGSVRSHKKGGGGDDARSITSASSEIAANKSSSRLLRVLSDKADTESICSIISSVYSDEDIARRSANAKTLHSVGNSSVGHGGGGGSSTARGTVSKSSTKKGGAGGCAMSASSSTAALATGRTAKMSPRQRMLQQQEEQLQQQVHHRRLDSSVSSTSTSGGGHLGMSNVSMTGPSPNNAPLPTNGSESVTTPFSSRCFVVGEGTDPFFWGSPSPRVITWLQGLLEECSASTPASSPSNNTIKNIAAENVKVGESTVATEDRGEDDTKKRVGGTLNKNNSINISGSSPAATTAAVGAVTVPATEGCAPTHDTSSIIPGNDNITTTADDLNVSPAAAATAAATAGDLPATSSLITCAGSNESGEDNKNVPTSKVTEVATPTGLLGATRTPSSSSFGAGAPHHHVGSVEHTSNDGGKKLPLPLGGVGGEGGGGSSHNVDTRRSSLRSVTAQCTTVTRTSSAGGGSAGANSSTITPRKHPIHQINTPMSWEKSALGVPSVDITGTNRVGVAAEGVPHTTPRQQEVKAPPTTATSAAVGGTQQQGVPSLHAAPVAATAQGKNAAPTPRPKKDSGGCCVIQ